MLILGNEQPVRAALKYSPFVTFIVVAVVTLSVLYKGMLPIFSEGRLKCLTGNNSFFVAAGIGTLMAILSRYFIGLHLENKASLSLSDQLRSVERVFAPLVIITSCSIAFAHGANDVANSIGPLAAIVDIVSSGTIKMRVQVPTWVLAMGGAGIVVGLATYGYRVMDTMGKKITELTPSRGVAADLATLIVVLVCTLWKLPVSTTHTVVGAILGIGLARGLSGVNSRITRQIFSAWFITVPVAVILSMALFCIGRIFLFETIRSVFA